jgi:hypothetical protein
MAAIVPADAAESIGQRDEMQVPFRQSADKIRQ